MRIKKVLFLSAIDFKEKSIQVILNTPLQYAKNDFEVFYIVARDTSKFSNYYYEKTISPPELNIERFEYPLPKLHSSIKSNLIRTILNKIRGYYIIISMAVRAKKYVEKLDVDTIYGYEFHGVLAANILKFITRKKKLKIISRFQGTFYLTPMLKQKKYFNLLLNWDHLLALYLPSNLCIMTNDGTQGDWLLKNIKSRNLENFRFYSNGVKRYAEPSLIMKKELNNELQLQQNDFVIVSICRLEKIKRVDIGIKVMDKLINELSRSNVKFIVIGEGKERPILKKMAKDMGIYNNVIFTGAVANKEVNKYLSIADAFVSTFESSNVGNPLLESIRAKKLIFTINNGDTGSWIKHYRNGFIYDDDQHLVSNMAKDINLVIDNKELQARILSNIVITEREKVWSWEDRLNEEIKEVRSLLLEE
jgi:glycosyltransferase involved in cell wall biosynthesis